jgi:hypothetical protein
LIIPLVNKTDSDPLLLKPPAVNRRPGGQLGVVAVPVDPVPNTVELETSVNRGLPLLTQ